MGVLFEKWRYGFEILVQKPGYSVLAIEKNCNMPMLSINFFTKRTPTVQTYERRCINKILFGDANGSEITQSTFNLFSRKRWLVKRSKTVLSH